MHLRPHIETWPTARGRPLFIGPRGGLPTSNHYGDIWKTARAKALTAEELRRGIAERPYDLRHARVSDWLRRGIPSPLVAEWAGHTVEVLHRVYARVIDGQTEAAKRLLVLPPEEGRGSK